MESVRVGNAKLIRDLNQAGIFSMIHRLGPISRKELAEQTGYSAATVSNHVKYLIEEGFVIETEKGDSTGGRKPVYLTVNSDKGYIFSIEIGVNIMKIVIFDLKLNLVTKRDIFYEDKNNPEMAFKQISTEIKSILRENSLSDDDILGMGIAVPGLVNKDNGSLVFAPNLGWREVELLKYFSGCEYPVVVENEAKAAVIGEREFAYQTANNIVYVSINEGIGCGIIFDGKLYRGASGNAGEFGHIIIDSNGPECHCGNHGCWETLASENFIVNSYTELTGESNVNKNDIYRMGREGSSEINEIFRETGRNIGIGLVNIVNSLSPELLIIGGGISKIKDIIENDINEVLNERSLDVSLNKVDIKFSRLDDLAAVYGMAFLVFNKSVNFV